MRYRLLVLPLFLLLAACGEQDDDPEADDPVTITPGFALAEPASPAQAAIEPAVAYDGTRIHLVYAQSNGASHNLMYCQRVGGGSFSSPAPVYPASAGDSRRPSVWLDGQGTLHIVWVEGMAPNRDIWYATRSNTGVISAASNLSNTAAQDENNPRVHVDASGRVHAVWEGSTLPPNPTSAIFYRRTVGSVFASSMVLPFSANGISGEMADVAVDESQLVYVVWSESVGPNRMIRLMRSDDNGASFNNIANGMGGIAVGGTSDKTEPRIVCGKQGHVILAFVAQDTAGERGLFATYTETGGTFATPGQLYFSSTGGVRNPSLAAFTLTSGTRVVALAFNDGPGGGGNILVKSSRNGGATWPGDPLDLSQGNSQPATNQWPSVALDDNEVVLSWVAQPQGGGIARTFTSVNGYTLPD